MPSKLATILLFKCPRCGEGDLFKAKNPYSFGEITSTNTNCPHCGLKFEREPGYFYGSMYISYALNIALFITALIAYFLFFEDKISGGYYMLAYVGFTLMLFPIIYRLSRSIWINILVKYQPEARGEY